MPAHLAYLAVTAATRVASAGERQRVGQNNNNNTNNRRKGRGRESS